MGDCLCYMVVSHTISPHQRGDKREDQDGACIGLFNCDQRKMFSLFTTDLTLFQILFSFVFCDT